MIRKYLSSHVWFYRTYRKTDSVLGPEGSLIETREVDEKLKSKLFGIRIPVVLARKLFD